MKENMKKNKKKPILEDQHLVFLFPIKFEQFVHVLLEQQSAEEFFLQTK